MNFKSKKINSPDIIFIFQYDFKTLEYLNLENNEITNGGLKALQNKSLINIKFIK